jgi:hypothetical protein
MQYPLEQVNLLGWQSEKVNTWSDPLDNPQIPGSPLSD